MLLLCPPLPGAGALPPATVLWVPQPSQTSRSWLQRLDQQRLESGQSADPALPQGDGAFS